MPPPLPADFNSLPPQVKALVQLLAQGMTEHFLKVFPTGIADPNYKIMVNRFNQEQGAFMQQTSFAQLTAEHIDTMKVLNKSVLKLADLTAEALDETKPRRRRG